MKIEDLFDSQARESERLVRELERLEATWPRIDAEYRRLDQECVELAQKLAAARLAGSPTQISLEAELRARRLDRDRPRHNYGRQRDRLIADLERITEPTIRGFVDDSMTRVKGLTGLRHIEREAFSADVSGSAPCSVTHNLSALAAAKQKIFAAVADVREMRTRPLSEIKAKVADYQAQFANLEVDTLEVEDMSVDEARSLMPKVEPVKADSGVMLPSGECLIIGEPVADRVARRIESLKKELSQ